MRARVILLAIAAIGVASCDPGAGIRVRSVLRPAPVRGCLDSALRQSPVAFADSLTPAYVDRRRGEQHFHAFFKDVSVADLSLQALGDSASVTVDFGWMGLLENYPDSARRRMATQGSALITDLRRVCAPQSSDTVSCEQYQTFSKRSPCGSGAA